MTGGYRKIKLFSLMVALIVAGLAVVGGTWAWGVDYSNGDANQPLSKENDQYNVSLQYYNAGEYTTAIDKSVFSNAAWCPGKTEIVYLKLDNNEKFPVSCTLTLNVSDNYFDDVMSYAFIAGENLKDSNYDHPDNWKEFYEKAEMTPVVVKDGAITILDKHPLSFDETTDDDYYLALAIHMDENASSDYMGKSMSIQLKLQIDANYQPNETPAQPTAGENNGN